MTAKQPFEMSPDAAENMPGGRDRGSGGAKGQNDRRKDRAQPAQTVDIAPTRLAIRDVLGRPRIVTVVLRDQAQRIAPHQARPFIPAAPACTDARNDPADLLGRGVHELLHLRASEP